MEIVHIELPEEYNYVCEIKIENKLYINDSCINPKAESITIPF
jgi:hypothetical protein